MCVWGDVADASTVTPRRPCSPDVLPSAGPPSWGLLSQEPCFHPRVWGA